MEIKSLHRGDIQKLNLICYLMGSSGPLYTNQKRV